MGIFQVNFSNVWQQLVPPILRQPIQNAWGESLTQPLQINNVLFNEYISGSTYLAYDNGTTYVAGNRVSYSDRKVYENLTGSTGVNPLNANTWLQVNTNYLGARERSLYAAQKLTFEYALNRWFQVSGFYPVFTPTAITQSLFAQSANTIYIQTVSTSTPVFMMGQTGPYSSLMVYNSFYATSFMTNYFSGLSSYDYIIWTPNSLGLTESLVRNFADTINISGMQYAFSGY